MRTLVLLSLSVCAAACAQTPAPPAADEIAVRAPTPIAVSPPAGAGLEALLRDRIAQESPAGVSVALVDLETGLRIGIEDDVAMHAASTMKVPVLLELFRQAASGRYALDDSVRVKDEFTSIADGSKYSLSPEDDSEQALYTLVGRKTTLRDLAYRMITRSSNLATNILIERVTADSVGKTMDSLGAAGMRVLRGVEDIPAFRRGMNNTTTAAGLAAVLEAIARCEAGPRFRRAGHALDLPAEACGEIVDILADQHFTEMIPAGVPAGVRVANKTGWITGIRHDGAIVYPPGRAPYVLVVLTRGITDTPAAAAVASDISRMVWEELAGGQKAAPAADPEARALLERHARYRVDGITEREFTHREYWSLVGPLVDASPVLARDEIGRSIEGRPLYLVRYGQGPTRVLLWSQMHGDESTATMALADLFRFLDTEADDDTFNPRAFGDLMQSWGVSTVLIESGGWRGDPEKQYLRAESEAVWRITEGVAVAPSALEQRR